MSHPLDRVRQAMRVGCPFCFEWISDPRTVSEVYSPEGALGGRCACGAVFIVDETGRAGGQALMDAQAFLCDGDVSRALKLESGVHVDVETREYYGKPNSAGIGRGGYLTPKVWFVKLRQ
ncbi:hypothetical protein ACFL6C_05185 [Myxococcota bacterium]